MSLTFSIKSVILHTYTCTYTRAQRKPNSVTSKHIYLNLPYISIWLRWLRVRLQCWRPRFYPWVRKIPWRRERLLMTIFLLGEFHGKRSLEGHSPWSHIESDITEQLALSLYFILHTKLQPCLLPGGTVYTFRTSEKNKFYVSDFKTKPYIQNYPMVFSPCSFFPLHYFIPCTLFSDLRKD